MYIYIYIYILHYYTLFHYSSRKPFLEEKAFVGSQLQIVRIHLELNIFIYVLVCKPIHKYIIKKHRASHDEIEYAS